MRIVHRVSTARGWHAGLRNWLAHRSEMLKRCCPVEQHRLTRCRFHGASKLLFRCKRPRSGHLASAALPPPPPPTAGLGPSLGVGIMPVGIVVPALSLLPHPSIVAVRP